MTQLERSKLERCPKCDSARLKNYVHIRAGEDAEVFVECADCASFVARYTLRAYTSEDPYRSYLRLMRTKDLASGVRTRSRGEGFAERLWDDFAKVKEEVAEHEEARSVEDLLDNIE